MAGTYAGYRKYREGQIAKHGLEKYDEMCRERSSRGGSAKVPKGFSMSAERAAAAGHKGQEALQALRRSRLEA